MQFFKCKTLLNWQKAELPENKTAQELKCLQKLYKLNQDKLNFFFKSMQISLT